MAYHQIPSQHAIGQNQNAKRLRHHVTNSGRINTGAANWNTAPEKNKGFSLVFSSKMYEMIYIINIYIYITGMANDILLRARQWLFNTNLTL